jgi:pilus assembly protein CpaC
MLCMAAGPMQDTPMVLQGPLMEAVPGSVTQGGFTQGGGAPGAINQPIQVQSGTGVLLRLPQPAATVISAQPEIARVQPTSPTTLFLTGVSQGRTTVIATNAAGAPIVIYDVTVGSGSNVPPSALLPGTAAPTGVSPATAHAIQAAIASAVPGSSGVKVRAAGDSVILSGAFPNGTAMQEALAIAHAYVGGTGGVLNEALVVDSIQVNVRVRIAEIDRQITRQLGFNWQALGANSSFRFGLLTGQAIGGLISPLAGIGLAPLSSAAAAPNQLGAGFRSGNGSWDVNQVIDALAADQLISILAEPNLTALSGETASFLAGGEFPVPVSGSSGNGSPTITVEFKPYGVSLALIPTVLSAQRLNLRVRPEVSELTQQGAVSVPYGTGTITIPALTVRRAETTVELGSGQSFAIAGLLEKTSSNATNALPGIGELPVIGALFRSNDFQRGESDLVIIVTPYLVNPAPSPSAVHAPTDRFTPATDLDRVLLGRQLPSDPASGRPLDAGFILK